MYLTHDLTASCSGWEVVHRNVRSYFCHWPICGLAWYIDIITIINLSSLVLAQDREKWHYFEDSLCLITIMHTCILRNVILVALLIQAYETGNRYHLLHSVALLCVPLTRRPRLVCSSYLLRMYSLKVFASGWSHLHRLQSVFLLLPLQLQPCLHTIWQHACRHSCNQSGSGGWSDSPVCQPHDKLHISAYCNGVGPINSFIWTSN